MGYIWFYRWPLFFPSYGLYTVRQLDNPAMILLEWWEKLEAQFMDNECTVITCKFVSLDCMELVNELWSSINLSIILASSIVNDEAFSIVPWFLLWLRKHKKFCILARYHTAKWNYKAITILSYMLKQHSFNQPKNCQLQTVSFI